MTDEIREEKPKVEVELTAKGELKATIKIIPETSLLLEAERERVAVAQHDMRKKLKEKFPSLRVDLREEM